MIDKNVVEYQDVDSIITVIREFEEDGNSILQWIILNYINNKDDAK